MRCNGGKNTLNKKLKTNRSYSCTLAQLNMETVEAVDDLKHIVCPVCYKDCHPVMRQLLANALAQTLYFGVHYCGLLSTLMNHEIENYQ